jgi:hypothetical protein
MNAPSLKRQTQGAAHSGRALLPVATPAQPAQQPLFTPSAVAGATGSDEAVGRTVMRSTTSLKPHRSLVNHGHWPTLERLLALEKLGDAIFEEPLLVTHENVIVDGLARWHIAQRRNRATLLCIETQLSEQEALKRILQTQQRPEWLNAFSRIQLALELEPEFREQARRNQRNGGKAKASSNLTEDQRRDCRSQIAELAGASTGNVTKVKQVLNRSRAPELMAALQCGEISIHRAWKLAEFSISEQRSALGNRRSKQRAKERIRKLLAKHKSGASQLRDFLHNLRLVSTELKTDPGMVSIWKQIDDLLTSLEHEFPTERSQPDATQNDPQADPGRPPESLGPSADAASSARKLPESARLPDTRPGG